VPGAAWASDNWWGSLSDSDQRTVVNAMYDVTGRSAPYAEQEARGEQVADLLVEQGGETEGAAGRALGDAELSALQGSELLPRTGKLRTRYGHDKRKRSWERFEKTEYGVQAHA
jgi:hypothetical protein